MPLAKPPKQRDVVRRLLRLHGYDKEAVCAAYADLDRRDQVPRQSDMNGTTSEAYADIMWADGHKKRGPWIEVFCRQNKIRM